jgi:Na+/H+ antiporter NhaC
MIESYPVLTLLPPAIAIVLVVATRKVVLSLGAGVVAAALLAANLDPLETGRLVWEAFAGIFWADGAVNTWSVYILAFLLLLGVIAAFVMMSDRSAGRSLAGSASRAPSWATSSTRRRRR